MVGIYGVRQGRIELGMHIKEEIYEIDKKMGDDIYE